jgi:hypothetical protein
MMREEEVVARQNMDLELVEGLDPEVEVVPGRVLVRAVEELDLE